MTMATLNYSRDFSSQDNLDIQPIRPLPLNFQLSRQWLFGEHLKKNITNIDFSSGSAIHYSYENQPFESYEVVYLPVKEQVLDFSIFTSNPKKTSKIVFEIKHVGKTNTRYSFDEEY